MGGSAGTQRGTGEGLETHRVPDAVNSVAADELGDEGQGGEKRVEEADSKVAEAEEAKDRLTKELERTAPFEKEVREKNLLIGKLRHEGIILNDHLTKALRYLKKTKPDEQVDR